MGALVEPRRRRAEVVGSAIGGFTELMRQADILRDRGFDRVSPSFIPNVLVDSASGQLAIELGIRGPNYAIVSACATGSHTIGEGAELIRNGHADAIRDAMSASIDRYDSSRCARLRLFNSSCGSGSGNVLSSA